MILIILGSHLCVLWFSGHCLSMGVAVYCFPYVRVRLIKQAIPVYRIND